MKLYYLLLPKELLEALLGFCDDGLKGILSFIPEFGKYMSLENKEKYRRKIVDYGIRHNRQNIVDECRLSRDISYKELQSLSAIYGNVDMFLYYYNLNIIECENEYRYEKGKVIDLKTVSFVGFNMKRETAKRRVTDRILRDLHLFLIYGHIDELFHLKTIFLMSSEIENKNILKPTKYLCKYGKWLADYIPSRFRDTPDNIFNWCFIYNRIGELDIRKYKFKDMIDEVITNSNGQYTPEYRYLREGWTYGAKKGAIDSFKWLDQYTQYWRKEINLMIESAAIGGRIELLEWFIGLGVVCDMEGMYIKLLKNKKTPLNTIKWFREKYSIQTTAKMLYNSLISAADQHKVFLYLAQNIEEKELGTFRIFVDFHVNTIFLSKPLIVTKEIMRLLPNWIPYGSINSKGKVKISNLTHNPEWDRWLIDNHIVQKDKYESYSYNILVDSQEMKTDYDVLFDLVVELNKNRFTFCQHCCSWINSLKRYNKYASERIHELMKSYGCFCSTR